MGVISQNNQVTFKSIDGLIARLRTDLSSFDANGFINTERLLPHIRFILAKLGTSSYQEAEAMIEINNYTGDLPEDFYQLYAAYKVENKGVTTSENFTPFGGTLTYYIERTDGNVHPAKSLVEESKIEKTCVTKYRTLINTQEYIGSFTNPILLRLNSRVSSELLSSGCINKPIRSAYEIAIDKSFNKVYTNFNNESIYIQYYASPTNVETGIMEIPDDAIIEESILNYLKYQILKDLYINSTAPDVERRFLLSREDHERSFAAALSYVKLPSFQSLIDQIKKNRGRFASFQMR